MSEPNQDAISTRLWKLPRQFLLALINATSILVILAALLALVAIARVNNFVAGVTATMTEAALSKIDLPSRDVLANIRNLTEEVRALGTTLREIRQEEHPVLQSQIARLREALNTLNANVVRLTNARASLTDEAIGRLGRSLGEALMKMRGCAVDVGERQPDRPSASNAFELSVLLAGDPKSPLR